jgi:microcystin-dependent protein
LIKSSDDNTLFNDFALGFTQSLATTGVSTMTGAVVGAAGLVSSPSYTFNGATKTGFYLAGANQIGWASNGVQGATFNADTSATFFGTLAAAKGTIPIGALMDFAGAAAPPGWLLCFGQLVSTTTYALLFSAIGTTFGSGSGTFGIPDLRGNASVGVDNMGGSSGGRFPGLNLGVQSGVNAPSNTVISQANLPGVTLSVSGSTSGYIPTVPSLGGGQAIAPQAGLVTVAFSQTGGNATYNSNQFGLVAGFSSLSVSGSTSALGSGSVFSVAQPTLGLNKIIYCGV